MTNKKATRISRDCNCRVSQILSKKTHTYSRIDRNVPITFSRTWRISDSERMGSRWFAKITFLIERMLVTSD